jgi:N-acyl-D-aspartate/D-glutamate deacylase
LIRIKAATSWLVLECGIPEAVGKTIGEMARERAPGNIIQAVFDRSIDIVFELIIEDTESTWVMVRDKREYGVLSSFLAHPRAIPMTDVHALPADPEAGKGIFGYGISPAAYAMFPNYLSEFVLEKKLLSLEEAVRKITSLSAREVFNIRDRGTVEPGMYADLVLLDLDRLTGNHSFISPAQPPESIQCVFVNGSIAYEKGKHTGVRSGSVLRMR